MNYLLMGVSGCGKTTVGEALAAHTGGVFVDGDGLHPPENVVKMSARIPLTDDDRMPWLAKVRDVLRAPSAVPVIVACSALKRSYRDYLRSGVDGLRIVHLHGTQEEIAGRLAARKGHFMPPGLLDSQFATLELPTADEQVITVGIDETPEEIAAHITRLTTVV